MTLGSVRVAARQRDAAGEDVGAGEVQGVVGRLQERNRLAHVVQRDEGATLRMREARHRPVEAYPHVRVLRVVEPLECAPDDLFRAADLAHVAERIAEECGVAGLERRVSIRIFHCLDAPLVQLDGVLGPAGQRVRAAEVRIDLVSIDRSKGLAFERLLHELRRLRPVRAVHREHRKHHAGPQGSRTVGDGDCLVEQRVQLPLDVGRIAEAHGELEIGQAQLPLLLRRQL